MSMDKQIRDYVNHSGYEPIKARNLAKKLGVKKKRMEEFQAALERMQAGGELRMSESGRIQGKASEGQVVGIVRRTSTGTGYLIPHEPRPAGLVGDVFIDKADVGDAHSGDEAIVRLTGRRRAGGQRCGVVVDVVERATSVFVGTYFEDDERGWVKVDGKNFADPISVGDPGAKGARSGDKVVIEMLRFPAHGQIGEAVLTKVLGPRGEPGVDTLTVIHEYGLPVEFSEGALAEARIEAENFSEANLDGREDLTGRTIVTIDPVDARDFDDAISLERSDDGHWHLGVHIADVAHFVQPGSQLDRDATHRGTSVYLPTQVIPMLPEVISNGLASLQEGRVRYAKSAFIEFTPEGVPVHTRFARTAIKVSKRFAYEEVMPIVEAGNGARGRIPVAVRKLLIAMHELAMILRRRRYERGALELDMPEVKLEFDADGRVTGAKERLHDESHQIIEEFMLAANIAVATELSDRNIDFLRRIHGEPSPLKLKTFADFAQVLGFPLKNPQSRPALQALLRRVRGEPTERAINYALLRSMRRAEYSPVPQGHFALAEPHYCHFTSPIRRYPDLVVHRLIDSLLLDNAAYRGASGEDLLRLAKHCSVTERRAEDAERELTKIKLLEYLKSRIGDELDAVITGVDHYGFFCRGIELPAEGLVHVTTLSEHDYYEFDRAAMSLIGRRRGETYRLGDRVRVAVARVDVDRRSLDFRLVGRLSTAKRPAGRSTSSSNPTGQRPGKRGGKTTKAGGKRTKRRRT